MAVTKLKLWKRRYNVVQTKNILQRLFPEFYRNAQLGSKIDSRVKHNTDCSVIGSVSLYRLLRYEFIIYVQSQLIDRVESQDTK